MRQNLCLVVVLCLLPSSLRAASMPYDEDGQSQISAVPTPDPEQPTTGFNSSDTDEGGKRLRVSLPDKGEQEGKSVSTLQKHQLKIPEVEFQQDHSTGRLLVAVARTLVTTTASTTTVTVLSTCHKNALLVAMLQACTGRKRRRLIGFNQESFSNSEIGLDSSIGSGPVLVDKLNKKAGRFILWSSSITTVTIRTTSTNIAITVTAAFPCSAPGLKDCAG